MFLLFFFCASAFTQTAPSGPNNDSDPNCETGDFQYTCTVTNSAKKTVYSGQPEVLENNCFSNIPQSLPKEGGAAYFASIQITFKSCSFNENIHGEKGGAIYCSSCPSVSIDSCFFGKNKAADGGAIYFTSTKSLIKSTDFVRNSANSGGAVRCEDSSPIQELKDCVFYLNDAASGCSLHFLAVSSNEEQEPVNIETCIFFMQYTGQQLSNLELFNYKTVYIKNCYFLLASNQGVDKSGIHLTSNYNSESKPIVQITGPVYVNGTEGTFLLQDKTFITFNYISDKPISCKPGKPVPPSPPTNPTALPIQPTESSSEYNIDDQRTPSETPPPSDSDKPSYTPSPPEKCLHVRQIEMNKPSIIIVNSCFENILGKSFSGGALSISKVLQAELIFCNFSGNYGYKGGSIYAEDSGVTLDTVRIFESRSSQQGGALFYSSYSSDTKCIIRNCEMFSNFALKGCSLYIMTKGEVLVENSQFTSASSINMIYIGIHDAIIDSIRIHITNCMFFCDLSNFAGCQISLISKKIELAGSRFLRCDDAATTGFFLEYETDDFEILSCCCVGGDESTFPAVKESQSYLVKFYCSQYDDLFCAERTPSQSPEPTIHEIISARRQSYINKQKIRIFQAIFKDILTTENGGALYFLNCDGVSVSHSDFQDIKTYGDGGIIYSSQTRIEIYTSNFIRGIAMKDGGAIAFLVSSGFIDAISVTSCNFVDNFAGNGGAISIYNSMNLLFEKCSFSYNTASNFGNTLYSHGLNDLNLKILNSFFYSKIQSAEIYTTAFKFINMARCSFIVNNNSLSNDKIFIISSYSLLCIDECCCINSSKPSRALSILVYDPQNHIMYNCEDQMKCQKLLPTPSLHTSKPVLNTLSVKDPPLNIYTHSINENNLIINNNLIANRSEIIKYNQFDTVIPVSNQVFSVYLNNTQNLPNTDDNNNDNNDSDNNDNDSNEEGEKDQSGTDKDEYCNEFYLMPTKNNSKISIYDQSPQTHASLGFMISNSNVQLNMLTKSPNLFLKGNGHLITWTDDVENELTFNKITVSDSDPLKISVHENFKRVNFQRIDFYRYGTLDILESASDPIANKVYIHQGSEASVNMIHINELLCFQINSQLNVTQNITFNNENSTIVFEFNKSFNFEVPMLIVPVIKKLPSNIKIRAKSAIVVETDDKYSKLLQSTDSESDSLFSSINQSSKLFIKTLFNQFLKPIYSVLSQSNPESNSTSMINMTNILNNDQKETYYTNDDGDDDDDVNETVSPTINITNNETIHTNSRNSLIDLILVCADVFDICENISEYIFVDDPMASTSCYVNGINQTCLKIHFDELTPTPLLYIHLTPQAIAGVVIICILIIVSMLSVIFLFCDKSVKKYSDIRLGELV
ncbi:hypothetical protein TRFO_19166 [Tritrichomonas foetus]|uniref:Right handed beta helix domain-containing protein n=1 Tax=Tritrichomonas foetus TaxID=1144522 RepID=A0A1J4KJ42_9EUKA|nr:hypothetical protein TRFO_19166 [Tritrichomonas foetus]|eukprot:OHT11369.1 hypothetical protein TRFO_19166 [Tritrichomonas foetus]